MEINAVDIINNIALWKTVSGSWLLVKEDVLSPD